MCVVSMVTDHWNKQHPDMDKYFGLGWPQVSRIEFEALRKEVLELKELLKAAKLIDIATDQPNCEKEENVKLIKKLAESLGVDMEDLLDGTNEKS